MKFNTLIKPLSKKDFMQRYRSGACFVIRGTPDKFLELVSLDDIESRLNDGCNVANPVEIIEGGARQARIDKDCAWTSMAVRKQEVLDSINRKCSFMMPNSSQISPGAATLISEIEKTFKRDKARADLHLYVSSAGSSSAYNAHRDFPQHKIYLQVMGSTQWTIFRHDPELPNDVVAVKEKDMSGVLEVVQEFTLDQGDMFYMPPSVFHRIANPAGPRVSFSIPFTVGNRQGAMDRTYIPFRRIFESHLAAAAES